MIKLLDCTLRDGGYINDWNFNKKTALNIVNGLIKSNIDLIEIGFLDERVDNSKDRTIFNSIEAIDRLFSSVNKRETQLYAMIDYGTFNIDKIPNKDCTLLDGIRVIFTQSNIKEAIEMCNKIKDKGYKVYANAVNITNYKESDYELLFNEINNSKVDGVTIVDTYGVLDLASLKKIYNKFDRNVNPSIAICFHAHNTLQMAVANAISITRIANKERETIVDGTLSGMGKGAGNAYTELLVNYMNHIDKNCKYEISSILDLLEHEMTEIKKKYKWDFSLCRFVSAIHNIYYKYTDYYTKVKGLNYSRVAEIEGLITEDDKFNFSVEKAEHYLEQYYFMNNKYKYVIFDIDGTLLNTTTGIISAIDYTIKSERLNDLDYTNKLYFIEPPIEESFKNAYNLSTKEAMRIGNVFRNRYKDKELYKAKLYKGIIELLSELQKRGIVVAVATYKREDYAIDILNHFEIDKYCSVIHGSDYEGKLSKCDVVKKVIEELNVTSLKQTVLVGDGYSDYEDAKNNNIDFIGVTYGFGFDKESSFNKSLKLVQTVDELKSRLL